HLTPPAIHPLPLHDPLPILGGNTPGDGLPLNDVNPAFDLVDLRPPGFEPKVTGLDWMGDDLLVLTWGDEDGSPDTMTEAGEVWRDRKSTRLNSSHVKISYAV